jgi:hypothetical protein
LTPDFYNFTWITSLATKLVAGIVLSALFYYCSTVSPLPLSFLIACVWLCIFFPERSPLILGLGSILFFFFSMRTTGILLFGSSVLDLPGTWARFRHEKLFDSVWAPFALKLGMELLAALLIWLAIRQIDGRRNWSKLAFAFLLVFLPILLFTRYEFSSPYLAYCLVALTAISVKLIWGYLLLANSGKEMSKISLHEFWIVSPLWCNFLLPTWRPFRPAALGINFSSTTQSARWKTIYFSICALGVLWIDQKIFAILIGPGPASLRLPYPWGDSVPYFLENVPSLWVAWALIIYAFIRFAIIILGVFFAIPYLILLNAGIPTSTSWASPHRSKSFHEFCSRVHAFYVQLNVMAFYRPFATSLGFLGSYKKLRIFVATYLSTFTLAFFYHFLRFIGPIFSIGFYSFVQIYLSRAIFFDLAIATVTAVSVLLAVNQRPRPLSQSAHLFRFILIVFLYSLLMTLIYSPQAESPWEKLRLWKFLFTGERG